MKQKKNQLIPEDSRVILRKEFSHLTEEVRIVIFTEDTENRPFNEYSVNLINELAETSEKIKPVFEKITGDTA